MTVLVLVRHGETLWNSERRIQGQRNSELSPRGLAQAEAVAGHLRSDPATMLLSSDLGRTMQTAAPLARVTGLSVEPQPRLRERAFGIFEGMTVDEIRQRHPREYARWRSRDPEYALPGGESLLQVRERVSRVLEGVAARGAARVIAVTHGGVLDAVYRITCGIAEDVPRDWVLRNASINAIEIVGSHWHLRRWGDIDHLGESDDDGV